MRIPASFRHACVLLLAALLLGGGCGQASEKTTVLRLSHALDTAHPVHRGMAYMAERVQKLSGGTMRVDLFPSAQLGNERESIELLQLGMLDMAKVSSSVLENFVPAMGVYSLPYLFEDDDAYWRVFNSKVGQEILLQGERYWIRGLCYYDAGFRSFYMHDTGVREPGDLQGKKIRVMRSNLSVRTINALGGNATPMAYGEIYTALQQGIVDGAENNPPNFYQSKHYELSDYYVLDGHSAPPDVLIIGTPSWEKLNEEQRGWLQQAVEESVERQRALWKEATAEALAAVEAAGVEVIRPEKAPFREAVAPIYRSLEGTELGQWSDRIRALTAAESPDADADTAGARP